jgi:hypothetical protein
MAFKRLRLCGKQRDPNRTGPEQLEDVLEGADEAEPPMDETSEGYRG